MKFKRQRSKDTVLVIDSTKVAAGPVRLVLMRTMTPLVDPYENFLSPHTDMKPYLEGLRRYSAVLFFGQKLRFQVEIGER
jgi:hypothetical protein